MLVCVLLLIWVTTINYIYQVVLHYQLFFLFLVASFTPDGALEIGNLGAKGLFTGMIAGLGSVELYNFVIRRISQ